LGAYLFIQYFAERFPYSTAKHVSSRGSRSPTNNSAEECACTGCWHAKSETSTSGNISTVACC